MAAWASSGGEPHSESLSDVLVLVVIVSLAYLIAHFAVEVIERRFQVISGLEYVFLGALLGPAIAPGIHVLDNLTAMAPVIGFAAGWVGLLYGMEVGPKNIAAIQSGAIRLALVDGAITGSGVFGAAYLFFKSGWLVDTPAEPDALVAAAVLGCTAAAGSSSAVDLLRARYEHLQTGLVELIGRTARLGDMLAILVFGLVFCFVRVDAGTAVFTPDAADWLIASIVLGVGLGLLFTVFLGDTVDEHQRFLAMVGIMMFASGAAFVLNLSALLVNLLLGLIIVRTKHGEGVYDSLERSRAPVRLMLLLFAGAMWEPVDWYAGLALTFGVIGVRSVTKALASWLATVGTPLRSDVARGLIGQGDVAIAMAISFKIVYSGPAVDLAYTAIIAAAVCHEFVGPRLLKGLLVDAGELQQDMEPIAAPPNPISRGL